MTPELKREALKVLDESLLRSGAQRLAYLDQACGADGELREEVETLLAGETAASELFDQPLLPLPRNGGTELRGGDSVGRFQVLREIGRGGMGTVYLGKHPDFGTDVAIKVLRPDRAQGGDVARFQLEQAILAKLEHPGVVRPLERGQTPDGLPFLVMDYVRGVPIDRYCEQQDLSTSERLELFRKVCSIVHFAHQNLIVHRDLKPANILVTEQGEPKLLDFGIAGLLQASPYSIDAEALRRKPAISFLGTLRYASPEQIRDGDVARTVSDVYSLGVILFELLTGHRPFEAQERSFVELSRAICEAEPEVPSTTVGQPVDAAQGEDAGGGSPADPAGRLRRRLSGDLDAIVLKAIAKDPDARYPSSAQLSDDIRRHQQDFPVVARDDTLAYRAGKLWRRHTATIVTSLVMLFVIFSFAGAMAIMWDREREAREEQERAFFVADYIVKLFEVKDVAAAGEVITAHQLLDDGVPFLERARRMEELTAGEKARLEEQLPEDLPGLMEAVGWAYYGLGSFAEAGKWLAESVDRRRAAAPDDDRVLGLFRLAAARRALGQESEARTLQAAAKRMVEEEDVDGKRLAQVLSDLGYFLEDRGDLRTAEAVYGVSVDMKKRFFGRTTAAVAIGLGGRALVLAELGRFEEAEADYRESLAVRLEVYGQGTVEVARAQNNLAALLRDAGALDAGRRAAAWSEAEQLFRDSLATRAALSGPDDPTVAGASNNLAVLLQMHGQLAEAGALYDDALRVFRRHFGEQHRAAGTVLKNRATWLQASGELVEAEQQARQAVKILDSRLGPGHWRTAEAESVLGGCLLDLDRRAEAEPFLRRSLAVIEAEKGERGRVTLDARQRLERLEAL